MQHGSIVGFIVVNLAPNLLQHCKLQLFSMAVKITRGTDLGKKYFVTFYEILYTFTA